MAREKGGEAWRERPGAGWDRRKDAGSREDRGTGEWRVSARPSRGARRSEQRAGIRAREGKVGARAYPSGRQRRTPRGQVLLSKPRIWRGEEASGRT